MSVRDATSDKLLFFSLAPPMIRHGQDISSESAATAVHTRQQESRISEWRDCLAPP